MLRNENEKIPLQNQLLNKEHIGYDSYFTLGYIFSPSASTLGMHICAAFSFKEVASPAKRDIELG